MIPYHTCILDYKFFNKCSNTIFRQISNIINRILTAYPLYIRNFFLKIKHRGRPVRNVPRHKLEVIKLLIFATEPVKTRVRSQIFAVKVLIINYKMLFCNLYNFTFRLIGIAWVFLGLKKNTSILNRHICWLN